MANSINQIDLLFKGPKFRTINPHLLSMPANGSGNDPYCSFKSRSILNSMCSTFAIIKSISFECVNLIAPLKYYLAMSLQSKSNYFDFCMAKCSTI